MSIFQKSVIENYRKQEQNAQRGIPLEMQNKSSKRERDGVFYPPKYITKYIVDNTLGKLCTEKKIALDLTSDLTDNAAPTTKKQRIAKIDEYRHWLLSITVCDPACGSGAFLNAALEFLITEHKYIDELATEISGDKIVTTNIENKVLENNIFGIDVNEDAIEVAKEGRKLNDMSHRIKCGNSLIDDPAIVGDQAFCWEKEFPQVFANGGFDVVIGNPPHVQMQSLGEESEKLSRCGFETYSKTGDLYCLFYERGIQILKSQGNLGFITSNRWMQTRYGEKLRAYLMQYNPLKLVNFGARVFGSETVGTSILVVQKTKNKNELQAANVDNKKPDLSSIALAPMEVGSGDDWVILSPIERYVKQKIEEIGTPLNGWEIEFGHGVSTRDKLIAQDARSAKTIKPVLQCRDIRRYSAKQNNSWSNNPGFNLPEFSREKLVWCRYSLDLRFCYDDSGAIPLDNTCFACGETMKYLCAFLNSLIGTYLLRKAFKASPQYFQIDERTLGSIRVPRLPAAARLPFEILTDCVIISQRNDLTNEAKRFESVIDGLFFDLYFSDEMRKKNCYTTDRLIEVLQPFTASDTDEFKTEYVKTLYKLFNNDKIVQTSLLMRHLAKPVQAILGAVK